MKTLRASLIAVAICAAAVAFGYNGGFGVADTKNNSGVEQPQVAAACARCGDGVCARSCENERTCPADCKATSGSAKTATVHNQP